MYCTYPLCFFCLCIGASCLRGAGGGGWQWSQALLRWQYGWEGGCHTPPSTMLLFFRWGKQHSRLSHASAVWNTAQRTLNPATMQRRVRGFKKRCSFSHSLTSYSWQGGYSVFLVLLDCLSVAKKTKKHVGSLWCNSRNCFKRDCNIWKKKQQILFLVKHTLAQFNTLRVLLFAALLAVVEKVFRSFT